MRDEEKEREREKQGGREREVELMKRSKVFSTFKTKTPSTNE
jgi:hypothetical protein